MDRSKDEWANMAASIAGYGQAAAAFSDGYNAYYGRYVYKCDDVSSYVLVSVLECVRACVRVCVCVCACVRACVRAACVLRA